jgi:uncharacterized protein (TIGR00369 family)
LSSVSSLPTGFDIHIPFVEHIGLRLLEKRDGIARMRLDPRPEFENSWGAIHGGVLLSVLDVVLSSSSRSLDETCIGATTVEIKTNFIAASRGVMLAEGRAQRAGRSLIYAEGELRDEEGALLAKATGTFKLLYSSRTE